MGEVTSKIQWLPELSLWARGPDLQKVLGKILRLAQVFPKFILSYKVKIFIDFYT